jgi:hypothetical protein
MATPRTQRRKSALARIRRFLAGSNPEPVDYLSLRPAPSKLVDDAGQYATGWYDHFDGDVNTDDAATRSRRFHRWFHLHFDTPTHFIVANIAHLTLGGNTSLLIMEKETGAFFDASDTGILHRNDVSNDPRCQRFESRRTGAFIAMEDGGERVRFDIPIETLRLRGTARTVFDRPFVQVTGTFPGLGSLQWWGNLEIEEASVRMGEQTLEIPAGSLGGYDRTLGHRRPIQHWNWIAAAGQIRDIEEDRPVSFSIISATDQAGAVPMVDGGKNNLWIDGKHHKLGELRFDYEITDPVLWNTGPWHLNSTSEHGRVDLRFEPAYRRREKKAVPMIMDIDFHQYYGRMSGDITVADRTYKVRDLFTLTEDSWMVM